MMNGHRYVRGLATLGLTLLAVHAAAQSHASPAADSPRVEITPYVSLGSAQSSLFGTAVAFPWTSRFAVEGEVGYRGGEVHGPTADVSVLYTRRRGGRPSPYVAAGIGVREYGSALVAPDRSLLTRSETAAVLNVGGGLKVGIDPRWGIRADVRWFNGLGAEAPEHWRLFTGVILRIGGTADQRQ